MFKNVVWRGTGCDKVKMSQTFRFMFHRKSQYFLLLLQNDFCIFNKKLDLLGSMYVLSNKLYFLNKGRVSVFTLHGHTKHFYLPNPTFPVAQPAALLMPELPPILTGAELISHFNSHFSAMQIRDGY